MRLTETAKKGKGLTMGELLTIQHNLSMYKEIKEISHVEEPIEEDILRFLELNNPTEMEHYEGR